MWIALTAADAQTWGRDRSPIVEADNKVVRERAIRSPPESNSRGAWEDAACHRVLAWLLCSAGLDFLSYANGFASSQQGAFIRYKVLAIEGSAWNESWSTENLQPAPFNF